MCYIIQERQCLQNNFQEISGAFQSIPSNEFFIARRWVRLRHHCAIVEEMYIHCCFRVIGNASLRRDTVHFSWLALRVLVYVCHLEDDIM